MVAVLEHLMLIVSSNKNDTNQNAKEVVPCTYLIIRIIFKRAYKLVRYRLTNQAQVKATSGSKSVRKSADAYTRFMYRCTLAVATTSQLTLTRYACSTTQSPHELRSIRSNLELEDGGKNIYSAYTRRVGITPPPFYIT